MSGEAIAAATFELDILEPFVDEETEMKFQCRDPLKHVFKLRPRAFIKRKFTCKKCAHRDAVKNFRKTRFGFIQTMIKDLLDIDRAKGRTLTDPIDNAWVEERAKFQDGLCHFSGLEFNFTSKNPYKVSIDRNDNSQGHNKINCVLVLACVNTLKHVLNHDEFIEYIQLIHQPQESEWRPYSRLVEREKKTITNAMSKMRKPGKREKRKGIGYDITHEEFEAMRLKHRDRCAITGAPGTWMPHSGSTLSVDKIDPHGTYHPDNCQLVLKNVNYLKDEHFDTAGCLDILKATYERITSGRRESLYPPRTAADVARANDLLDGFDVRYSEYLAGDWMIFAECPEGHTFSSTLMTLEEGHRCPDCKK
jgi:hypothetical protein